jgi:lipopolysaccharide assembly outer membrane protein LptD (OstA)
MAPKDRQNHKLNYKRNFFLFLVSAIFLTNFLLWSQTTDLKSDSEELIRLLARYQEKKGEVVLASGEVELHFRDLTLLADRLEVNTSSYEVVAEGNVTLQLPTEAVTCERLTYNLKTREGKLENVRAIARPSLLFGAKKVNKSADNFYDLENAWLTTCTQPVPRWSFAFSEASLKLDDYLSMKRAVFKIKDLPVLYVPYLRYPLKERATGFLFPQVGYNRVKGFSLSQSFYWAISRNTDATLTADYYSKQGEGAGVEYRYLLRSGTKGDARVYVFFFKKDATGVRPDPAYLLRFNHQQTLPFNFRLTGQVDYSSSFNFLREFENNFSSATVNNRSYQLNLSKSWSYFNLNIRSSRFETYFPQTGQSVISAYLPQATFNLLNYRLLPSVYLSWESGVSNWQYSWKSQDQTETTYSLGNGYFRPALSLPLKPAPWLNLTATTAGIFTWYFQSYEPETTNRSGQPLLTSQARFGFNLEGPVFYRIFFQGGEPFLKHLVIPYISYSFDSPLSQQTSSRIISPFGIFRNNDFKYGLNQHLLVKNENGPREILTLGFSQAFYLNPENSPIKFYYPQNPERHFSPVNAFLRYYPQNKFSFDMAADFNPYENNFLSSRLSANYGAPEDNFFFSLNWSKSYQILGPDSFFRSNQVGLQGSFRWPEKLEFKAQIELDLQQKKVLYTGLAGIYHYQCLDFSFDLRVFYYRSRPETQFKFSVGLGNISRTTDLLGAFGF